MTLKDDLNTFVKKSFKENWSCRKGQVVPEPTDLKSSNDAVEFDRATVLYADISGSTSMVNSLAWHKAAELYKNFLYCSARLITDNGGTITAYDGDRVMGVFVGDRQSTPAAKCALRISYAVSQIIMPAYQAQYPNDTFKLRHTVGIDTSAIKVAKTGVRGDNDLVWIGRAANYAAKLTELSANYSTWITGDLYSKLLDDAKFGGNPKEHMWTKHTWNTMNNMEIYGSTWWMTP
jgi:class 3 adenylate cyclase